jgi:hypothetical protein
MVLSVNTSEHILIHTSFEAAGGLFVIVSVSAPFRGTHSVYTLGEKPASPPDIRFFSVGAMIAMIIHVCMFFSPFFSEDLWDLLCEARSYSCKDISVLQFLKNVWKSGWAESEDIAPYDVTYQSVVAREKNGEGVVNKGTYYTSYATNMVRFRLGIHLQPHTKTLCYPPRRSPTTSPIAVLRQTSHIFSISRSTSYLERCARTISPGFIRSPISCTLSRMGKTAINYTRTTEWCQYFHSGIHYLASTSHFFGNNKGTHSLFMLSFALRETKCIHHRALTHPVANELVTGTWDVFTIDGATHASIVPRWTGSELQTTFFEGLGERLQLMEAKWAASRVA